MLWYIFPTCHAFQVVLHFPAISWKYSQSWRPHVELMKGLQPVRDSLSCIQRVNKQGAQNQSTLKFSPFLLGKTTFGRPEAAQVPFEQP